MSAPTTICDLRAIIERREQERKNAVLALVRGVRDGDIPAIAEGVQAVDQTCSWREAMSKIARLRKVPCASKEWFIGCWIVNGDSLRSDIGDDRILMDALRVLLPPYTGAAMTLFRGDSFVNRCRRTYGMSWSSSLDVAQSFAQGVWQKFDGGSVLLRAEVPSKAIIFSPAVHANDYEEDEYLVDRRYLGKVEVVKRFEQASSGD
ncbi:hypothetical protein [Azospirillum formosense]|uniref:hypothetical protein n=1 Tax=Azospirillum formosense TaxID=861533 RepID=UPI00338DF67F